MITAILFQLLVGIIILLRRFHTPARRRKRISHNGIQVDPPFLTILQLTRVKLLQATRMFYFCVFVATVMHEWCP